MGGRPGRCRPCKATPAWVWPVVVFTFVCLLAVVAVGIVVLCTEQRLVDPFVVHASHPNHAVDAVFTWVDSSDAEWRSQKNAREAEVRGAGPGGDQVAADDSLYPNATSNTGAPEYTELYWAMRCLACNAPWIRRVYVVTHRPQRPGWVTWSVRTPEQGTFMGTTVRLVHHDEILPRSALPVFNSHAIEAALHRIPELCEHFVYLNDDFYIQRPVSCADFFTPAGSPIIRLENPLTTVLYSIIPRSAGRGMTMAWDNLADLGFRWHPHLVKTQWHHASPLTRSLMAEAEASPPLREAWARTQTSTFRSETDVPPIGAALMYGAANNRAVCYTLMGMRNVVVPASDAFAWVGRLMLATLPLSRQPSGTAPPRFAGPTMLCVNEVGSATSLYRDAVYPRLLKTMGTMRRLPKAFWSPRRSGAFVCMCLSTDSMPASLTSALVHAAASGDHLCCVYLDGTRERKFLCALAKVLSYFSQSGVPVGVYTRADVAARALQTSCCATAVWHCGTAHLARQVARHLEHPRVQRKRVLAHARVLAYVEELLSPMR